MDALVMRDHFISYVKKIQVSEVLRHGTLNAACQSTVPSTELITPFARWDKFSIIMEVKMVSLKFENFSFREINKIIRHIRKGMLNISCFDA